LHRFGRRKTYHYRQCVHCGTVQLAPLPRKTDLDRAYRQEYAASGHIDTVPGTCNAAARPYHQAILRLVQDHRVQGKVLDYGAGWGGLCKLLLDDGYRCQGLDASGSRPSLCPHCTRPWPLRGIPSCSP